MKQEGILHKNEWLNTTRFLYAEKPDVLWGVVSYLGQAAGATNITKKAFPQKMFGVIGEIMLIKAKDMGGVINSTFAD